MKKIILLFFICLIPIKVNASTCIMDMDTTRLLYGDNENQENLIASTTKLMTALVVINNVENLEEQVEVSESVLKSTGSNIYIEVGEHMKVKDLLYGLLLRSGNDAAITLAEYVGGSIKGFTLLMNETASSLNMNHTKFLNPHGLEESDGNGNTSTCYDLALLMSYISKNKQLMTILNTKHHEVKTDYKSYDWHNKNKLLYMYKYTTGGKTGYTKKAHRTLVTSATKDNKNLAIVTLEEKNDFQIHKNLYETYFKKYKLVNILDKKHFLKKDKLYIKNNFNMLLKENEINNIKIEIVKTNDTLDRAGYVKVLYKDKLYYKDNIYKK